MGCLHGAIVAAIDRRDRSRRQSRRQFPRANGVREYVFYVFFHISKNVTVTVFFEMTCQKVVKRR